MVLTGTSTAAPPKCPLPPRALGEGHVPQSLWTVRACYQKYSMFTNLTQERLLQFISFLPPEFLSWPTYKQILVCTLVIRAYRVFLPVYCARGPSYCQQARAQVERRCLFARTLLQELPERQVRRAESRRVRKRSANQPSKPQGTRPSWASRARRPVCIDYKHRIYIYIYIFLTRIWLLFKIILTSIRLLNLFQYILFCLMS